MIQEFDRPKKRVELAGKKPADGLINEPGQDEKYGGHGYKPEAPCKNENGQAQPDRKINGLPLPIVFKECKILIG